MSNMKEIKNALISVLDGYQDLKDFIKGGIFEGITEGIIDYPCLILEPVIRDEEDVTYPTQRITARYAIVGCLKVLDKSSQLDEIFDFENLVLQAIGSDRRLGGTAEHTTVVQSSYNNELWPIRTFTIQVDVQFRQKSDTR